VRGDPVGAFVEVFRSRQARACRERALVLNSQSIPFFEQEEENGEHVLHVEEHWAQAALEQLRRYEEENRGFRLRRALPPAAPFARGGLAVCALVVSALTLLAWGDIGALGWQARGGSLAEAVRGGELARALTALTLHADVPHLLSNLLFGALFGYLWFHALGGGVGALAMLLAGTLGNLTNAWIQPAGHFSIGASTAVFGAVGLLCGSEARTRHLLEEHETRRFAPIGGALVFLLYLGVGEAQTANHIDVLAHVFGLAWGLILGAGMASLPRARIESRGFQLACALATALLLALGWSVVLR